MEKDEGGECEKVTFEITFRGFEEIPAILSACTLEEALLKLSTVRDKAQVVRKNKDGTVWKS